MSRIHEALLKAQKEQGRDHETLDIEALKIELPNFTGVVPEVGPFSDKPIATTSTVIERVTEERDAVQFQQHSWRPDKNRLVFMKPELTGGLEVFRSLRSRLLRERTQRYLKTILITSAAPGEGKTFVTANLALAMSRHQGSRVLVIDADLRRSNLHSVFGMEAVPGLSTYLDANLSEIGIVRQTPEPQLCVVTAGKESHTPTELLHSRRMQAFVENMSRHFDWIFLDSPPAAAVADSFVLSDLCDGVLLVVVPGGGIQAAQKCRKEFGQKILGVVLNRVEDEPGSYGYYDYSEKSKKKSRKNKKQLAAANRQ